MAGLDQSFDFGTLATQREAIRDLARRAGLPDERAVDVMLAVHELLANAVRHGAGAGRLRVWLAAGMLRCQVDDTGRPGEPDRTGSWPVLRGHGLWVAQQVADQMEVRSGPCGTRATVSFDLGAC
jgi:serine/threonine-protein kinase RsbW